MMRRVLHAPLLHFLVLGVLLLAGRAWWDGRAAHGRIVVTAEDVARLRDGWTREHGMPPAGRAEAALIGATIDDEVLFREAIALGIDRADGAVRERLVRLGGFVGEDEGSADAMEREARRLGLDRSDLVIRRHLVQMMRLATERVGAEDMPTGADLGDYLARHADEFAEPARVSFAHVYVSRERRGVALEAQAAEILARLRGQDVSPEDAASLGDPFIRGARVAGASEGELEQMFGPGFAAALRDVPQRTWVGPLRSSYGLHLVWVRERIAGHVPPLAAVRSQVLHRLVKERGEARARERMQALRARYDVRVETALQ
jgi:peptidyl-prolyl cis-trans isomerase C